MAVMRQLSSGPYDGQVESQNQQLQAGFPEFMVSSPATPAYTPKL